MQIEKIDTGNLTAEIVLTLEKADYNPKLQSELNKTRQKVALKGFRKGKTPMSYVRKMFGNSVLYETVNEVVSKKLDEYLKENEIKVYGYPLPSEKQGIVDMDISRLGDYTFHFDIGIEPEVTVEGMTSEDSYDYYVADVSDEVVNKEWEKVIDSHKVPETVDSAEEEKDFMTFEIEELSEENELLEGGHKGQFHLYFEDLKDNFVEKVKALKSAEHIDCDLGELVKLENEALLTRVFGQDHGKPEDTNLKFRCTLTNIQRLKQGEVNKEFFDQVFGPDMVSSEEEAKEKLKDYLEKRHDNDSKAMFFKDVQKQLLDKNDYKLPEAFLRNWLKHTNKESQQEVTDEAFDSFKTSMQWTLIRNWISDKYEITVEEAEVRAVAEQRIAEYFNSMGQGGMPQMGGIVDQVLQDEKSKAQYTDEVITGKVLDSILEAVTLNKISMPLEDFTAKLDAEMKEMQKHDHDHDHDHDHEEE